MGAIGPENVAALQFKSMNAAESARAVAQYERKSMHTSAKFFTIMSFFVVRHRADYWLGSIYREQLSCQKLLFFASSDTEA
jgi:hypothetical protein